MKKILIPYDFSDSSENVLNYALGLTKDLSAHLTLLHVTPYPVVTPEIGLPAFSYQDIMADGLNELKKLSDKIKRNEPSIKTIDCFSEMGDVSETIVEYCEKYPFDFVVMGIYQHGSKLMKVLMGSNAVETAHKIKCTVIIVPPDITYKKPAVIALANEQSNSSVNNSSIEKAKAISVLLKAELQILHVVPEDHHFAPSEVVLDNYFGQSPKDPTHKLYIITEKKVSEGILGMLDNKLIDMILVEPKEHNVFYKLFHESVSKELAFESPVPVVLIHS